MSPQGVTTHEKASHGPGLSPIKGHKFCPGAQTRFRDKLVSLPLGITKSSPFGPVLVNQPATEPHLWANCIRSAFQNVIEGKTEEMG